MSYVESKMVNAAGKMAKLLGTDAFLDGQGTSSPTIALDGFTSAVDDGGTYATYAGITRSDIATGDNVGINSYVATVPTLSLSAVQTAYGSCWFGNERVDLMPTTQAVWDILWSKIQPQQRFNEESSDVAKIGLVTAPCRKAGKSGYMLESRESFTYSTTSDNREDSVISREDRFFAEPSTTARQTAQAEDTVCSASKVAERSGNDCAHSQECVTNKVQSLRYNGASVVVDQYAPTGVLWFLNTKYIQFWISTMRKYQFGFTGWKEAQNTDDVAGQYMFGGNMLVVAPRLMGQVNGITG